MARALDVALAALLLAVASPMLGLAAIPIRLESRGPVVYRQRRVGQGGRPFELWKLRTMVPGAEAMGAGIYVLEGDPRITRGGRLLRRFSLDELPNLVNVAARGDGDRRARARRCRSRWTATPSASAGGSRSSPASPAGPR